MPELVETIDKLGVSIGNMRTEVKEHISNHDARLGELERRAASERFEDSGPAIAQNKLAAALAGSDELQRLSSDFRGRAVIKLRDERADITSGNTTVGTGRSQGTSLVPGQRLPGMVEPYDRELVIRDVIGTARTTSNVVEWVKETGFTNNTRPVEEGTLKPKSDLTFNLLSAPVRTIAHTFKISRQMVDDVPALAAYVGRRGTYGLKRVEEEQVLFGDGIGQNLNGIIPQAQAFAPPFASKFETPIDRILQSISQAENADIPVNAVVLSKQDWRQIMGTKDEEGRYISAQSPFGLADPRLWSLNIVASNSMVPGTFLTGAFEDGATIFDRLDTEVLLSSENEDDFVRNMISVRVESRLALAVFKPEAFVTGELYPA